MGYYMRFIATDKLAITIASLETDLKQINPSYSITDVVTGPRQTGSLKSGDDLYGMIEINVAGDGLFEEEIEEFMEPVRLSKGRGRKPVLKALKSAKTILAIQVLFQDRDTEETLTVINPIWSRMFAVHKGILQVDGEGFYDQSGLVLGESTQNIVG